MTRTCLRFLRESLNVASSRWRISLTEVSCHGWSAGGGGGGSFGLKQRSLSHITQNTKKKLRIVQISQKCLHPVLDFTERASFH